METYDFFYDYGNERRSYKLKNVFLFILAGILVMVALGSLGHIIGMAISLMLVYFSFKQFIKTESFFGKLFWAMVGICSLFAVLASLPAVAGIAALCILYVVYKNWKKPEKVKVEQEVYDPFESFDQQWNEIQKKYH
jgi:lia operon protein LiaI